MKLFTALLAFSACNIVLGGSRPSLCLQENVPNDDPAMKALNDIGELGTLQWLLGEDHDTGPRVIHLYYKIIEPQTDKGFRPVTKSQLERQLKAVTEAFRPYGFQIQYDPLSDKRVKNSAWSEGWIDRKGDGLFEAQRHLRRGNYLALNINIVPKLRNPDGGYARSRCTLPRHTYDSPGDYMDDGCFLSSDALPGGSNEDHDGGKILVHAIGHWLGLLHPWHPKDCQAGNSIGTAIARKPILTCEERADTCPSRQGADPTHNYMTFAPSYCQREFTNEQVMIMRNWWALRNQTDGSIWTPGGKKKETGQGS